NAVGQVFATEALLEERRRDNLVTYTGPGEIARSNRALAELGCTRVDNIVLATRGQRLALTHTRGGGDAPHSYEGYVLTVTEVDDAGRIVAIATFDADARDAAFRGLERRYTERAAAPA